MKQINIRTRTSTESTYKKGLCTAENSSGIACGTLDIYKHFLAIETRTFRRARSFGEYAHGIRESRAWDAWGGRHQ
jgi:hypothetical protein